jgi:hypothetical protein
MGWKSLFLRCKSADPFTYERELTVGQIAGTGISILSVSPGEIVFEIGRDVPEGNKWSGVINVFSFVALSTGATVVTISE